MGETLTLKQQRMEAFQFTLELLQRQRARIAREIDELDRAAEGIRIAISIIESSKQESRNEASV